MSVAVHEKRVTSPLVDRRPNISRGSKRSPYRTKSYGSDVDETLFGTPARYKDQKDTKRVMPEDVSWDPPWTTSPTKTGVPLLWTPFDPKDANDGDSAKPASKAATPRTPRSARNKYRPRKASLSFVDETLFGTPRKEPSFEAPWEANENKNAGGPLHVTWSPPISNTANLSVKAATPEKMTPSVGRGMTAHSRLPYTPVIKARPGSTINTPGSRTKPKFSGRSKGSLTPTTIQQKLDFSVEGVGEVKEADDPDAILQRALKLAGIASKSNGAMRHRSNSLGSISSRAASPGAYFWKRPSSCASSTGRPEYDAPSTPQSARGRTPDLDEFFSATGTRMPLSARGSPRPYSARSEKSCDSVPGLDFSKPSKAYGYRTPPLSARSVRSGTNSPRPASNLSNRPSWRP